MVTNSNAKLKSFQITDRCFLSDSKFSFVCNILSVVLSRTSNCQTWTVIQKQIHKVDGTEMMNAFPAKSEAILG